MSENKNRLIIGGGILAAVLIVGILAFVLLNNNTQDNNSSNNENTSESTEDNTEVEGNEGNEENNSIVEDEENTQDTSENGENVSSETVRYETDDFSFDHPSNFTVTPLGDITFVFTVDPLNIDSSSQFAPFFVAYPIAEEDTNIDITEINENTCSEISNNLQTGFAVGELEGEVSNAELDTIAGFDSCSYQFNGTLEGQEVVVEVDFFIANDQRFGVAYLTNQNNDYVEAFEEIINSFEVK